VAQSMPVQQPLAASPPLIQPPVMRMPTMQVHPAAMGSYQSYGSHLLRQVTAQQQQAVPRMTFGQPVLQGLQRKHIMPRDDSEVAVAIAVTEWIELVLREARHPSLSLFDWLGSGEVLCRLANTILNVSPNPHLRITGISRPAENAKKFVDICRLVGVGESDLFAPSDLWEGRNMGNVMRCLAALGGILQNYEWWVNSPFAQLGRRLRIQASVKA
jgi:hypothetical protein